MMQTPSRLQERHHLIGAPGHSLALHYEVLLKETRPTNEQGPSHHGKVATGPSQERIDTCFQVFDDLLAHLGVYQRVMKIVRDELYAAAYSGEFTSGCGRGSSTQPLPWCVIAGRLMGKKAKEHSKLKTEISSLKEQLYTCEADLEKATSSLESHRHDVKDRDGKLHRLSSELRTRTAECESLQKILGQHQHGQERMRQEAELRMYSLRNTIGNLKEDNVRLRQYKTAYDRLQEALSTPYQSSPPNQPASYKAELDQHARTTEKLKQQLLKTRNSLLDEYDIWLTNCVSGVDQGQLLPAAIVERKRNFKKNMAEVANELALLESHTHSLSERSSQVEDQLKAAEHEALVLPDHPKNPLLPQLQTSNKFAVMVHSSSDNGSTFYSVKEGQLCSNCGQKTVVCPHKLLVGDEVVLQLPLGSTHVKITQPVLQLVGGAKATPTGGKSSKVVTPRAGQHYLPPDFNKIWKTFWHKFANYKCVEPHVLTADETVLLTNQFCASLIQKDDRALLGEEDAPLTIMESLVEFVERRYHVASIVPLTIHSFITALSEHHTQNTNLLVLSHVLSGDLDGCALRQLLLLAELVELMPWNTIKDFSSFAAIVYPALQEEDIDHLEMNFISYGGNRVSAQLVMGFLTWLMIRHKDPHLAQFESKLSEYHSRSSGSMLEVEFAEAADSLVSLVSDQLCRHLFLQSLVQLQDGENSQQTRKTLPIKRLSYIACYLYTQSQMSGLRSRVEMLAQQITSRISQTSKPHPSPHHTQAQHREQLFTMETAKGMANRMKNIALCK